MISGQGRLTTGSSKQRDAVRTRARAAQAAALERLKQKLLRDQLARMMDSTGGELLSRAATEAAAVASLTKYPLLVLPELLNEKTEAARRYLARQAAVREKSRAWMALAA
jgi:hypothetical protein